MGSIPNPRTWVNKEIQPYDVVSAEVYGTVAWLLEPPMIKVRQTTGQSVPNNTATALNFQVEDIDPYNWHNPTNPSRITPTFPGWYHGKFGIGFSSATGGSYRAGWVLKNATAGRGRRDSKPTTVGNAKSLRGVPFWLSFNGTTDYVELFAFQDSGSSMTLSGAANINSELFLRWWGPL